jgi:hypothetical protein
MIDFITRLDPLMRKEPIVSTFDSRTLIGYPEEVITSYNQHATTYVELDLFRDMGQRFINKIVKSQTPKVCLVARYGYGKTTAAIGIWQACRRAHILAVPPAGYTSLAEMAQTVYSWACTALHDNASALGKLEELHSTYLRSSTEELAKLVSKRSGRSYEQVIEILMDPALVGSLRLDPPTTNIVLFLEALTDIVTTNGYAGVAVFVDEFQQLLGKAGADILTALRSLVWGLRTRKMPFGLVITMDPNSEHLLGERAGDILHRIKDDDLYLDFQQIHGSDFPRLLWERYAKQLNLDELTFRIVDKPTLEALGQICERVDLSNGPRTVANALRRIASYYVSTRTTYTPLQLIDDFLTGAIIFDGDANTIASLVTEFAGYAYFRRTEKHLAVLKLLAAFPCGCPPEVAELYCLSETFNEITSELRGDIITLLPGGYALIDLQRVGKPLNKLSLILKKYWMQISNNEEEPEKDIQRFAQYILPLLFPANTTQTESWKTEVALSLSADGTYTQTFVGYLHARHPLRRIRTIVCTEEPSTYINNETADINLTFVIHNHPAEQQRLVVHKGGYLVFYLNVGKVPLDGLSADLRLVEHNLSPQPGTPAVLLNVIEFVEREVSLLSLKQSELVQVNYTLDNLRRWLLNFIFDEHLLGAVDPEAATPGYRGVRDLLFRECERHYLHYNTLITSDVWQDNLARYRSVLAERTLAERRGIEPVQGSKATLAALFGQRNHAGFDSKVRVQYPYLLEITWGGEQGTLLFTSHPIETKVLTLLGDEGRAYNEIVDLCRAEGYAREEVEEVFDLLGTRGQIKEEAGQIYKTDTLSIAELKRVGTEFITELQALETVLPKEDLTTHLAVAHSLATLDVDSEECRQIGHAQLILLTEPITKLRGLARLAFLNTLEQERNKVATLLRSLDEKIPGFSAPVSFKNHLDGVRKLLEVDNASMRRSSVRLREAIQSTRDRGLVLNDTEIGTCLTEEADRLRQREEAVSVLQDRFKIYQQRVKLLKQWISWGENFVRLKHNISTLVVQLKDIEPVIIQLANKLANIENEVRESLSHNGVATLEQIDRIRQQLDEVTREYDRCLAARETAFEQEKARLGVVANLVSNEKKTLKSKYQISKHGESYQDLYGEVFQIFQDALDALIARARLLESRIRGLRGLSSQGSIVDHKAIKSLIRKTTEGQKKLTDIQAHGDTHIPASFGRFIEDLITLRKLLDDAELKVPHQIPLSLSAGILLAKVNVNAIDLRSLIDVKAAVLSLPAENDITSLLQLCLSEDIVIEVHRRSDLMQTDDDDE